jgi:hypothetical protein
MNSVSRFFTGLVTMSLSVGLGLLLIALAVLVTWWVGAFGTEPIYHLRASAVTPIG